MPHPDTDLAVRALIYYLPIIAALAVLVWLGWKLLCATGPVHTERTTDQPTRIVVHRSGRGWTAYGMDDEGRYTVEVWTDSRRATAAQAVAAADVFAAKHGWSHLPVVVTH